MSARVLRGDCLRVLNLQSFAEAGIHEEVTLTFFDPPFNQGKEYAYFNDAAAREEYWQWVEKVCAGVLGLTVEGGAIYFMQREKNTEEVFRCLRNTGWTLQNLIIWSKHTSAIPSPCRFGKQYQIIAFATKGKRPRLFNRLRIDPPLVRSQKKKRADGIFLTDCWNDIRELTSGYFAGDEALRKPDGQRFHEQQSPLALLARIILSSSAPGDLVLDPCAGTGTTLVAAKQLGRTSVGIEVDPANAKKIRSRLQRIRKTDSIAHLREDYRFTPNLESIWPTGVSAEE
ncbi:MAG: site-specific DNA-methyltransferase [Armatimonadetes bacterium]|nr:site-specific DNA-methyltransferase [Armatimonadota bacterium]NIM23219.1 site-specific DNA-methyltransferase [Armatimonadota bacterium]NIM67087.1 site-specific DNA-methyltransferase [Armatimonadota bacterium]NIM75614.1 site-specific DNA-methyltransferase [Armatimonadota bacterium]NIN05276.1 site-specific DNA-methyltransferase [Armatimonadota bacterium]